MAFRNLATWRRLLDVTNSFYSRAFLVISSLPWIIDHIEELRALRIDPWNVRLSFLGALLFLVAGIGVFMYTPPLVRHYTSALSFQDRIPDLASAIDPSRYFSALPMLLSDYGTIYRADEATALRNRMPPERAVSSLGSLKACFLFAKALYELTDVSCPLRRNALLALIVLSLALMSLSPAQFVFRLLA